MLVVWGVNVETRKLVPSLTSQPTKNHTETKNHEINDILVGDLGSGPPKRKESRRHFQNHQMIDVSEIVSGLVIWTFGNFLPFEREPPIQTIFVSLLTTWKLFFFGQIFCFGIGPGYWWDILEAGYSWVLWALRSIDSHSVPFANESHILTRFNNKSHIWCHAPVF